MQIRSLHWEDRLEEGTATHSSILAWSVPWTEEPGGLQSIESRFRHNRGNLARSHTMSTIPPMMQYVYIFLLNMFHKCGMGEGGVL